MVPCLKFVIGLTKEYGMHLAKQGQMSEGV